MNGQAIRAWIALVLLIGLVASPLAQTASPAEAKRRTRATTQVYDNGEAIHLVDGPNLPSPTPAHLYPSPIVVSGMKGTIRDVNVTLRGFGHDLPYDAQMLLAGPEGQTAILMAGSGGADVVPSVTLRLDDEAAAPIPVVGPLASGTYQPRNNPGGAITFTTPAPDTPANTALAIFDGADPNGEWRLFVQDAYGPTGDGYISGGWEVEIQTQFVVKKRKR